MALRRTRSANHTLSTGSEALSKIRLRPDERIRLEDVGRVRSVAVVGLDRLGDVILRREGEAQRERARNPLRDDVEHHAEENGRRHGEVRLEARVVVVEHAQRPGGVLVDRVGELADAQRSRRSRVHAVGPALEAAPRRFHAARQDVALRDPDHRWLAGGKPLGVGFGRLLEEAAHLLDERVLADTVCSAALKSAFHTCPMSACSRSRPCRSSTP
mmetsp:Transcript_40694/g.130856  ORF Transcript_40694/g.130856 Transcript_40694/m.130856 type:complete len:215 (-) Transcript_40694:616-1260(-)